MSLEEPKVLKEIQFPTIVSENFTPHFIEDLQAEQYHADKTAISSTALKKLLKSPKTFLHHYNEPPMERTAAMTFGEALHMALLEPERFQSEVQVEESFSGKGSREAKKEWLESLNPSVVLLSEKEYDSVLRMRDSAYHRKDVRTFLQSGQSEISGYYRDPVTGIKCKVRIDHYNAALNGFIDLKTCLDCSQAEFSKTIWNYRYDIQMAMYQEGLQIIGGKPLDYAMFLAIEKTAPYEVAFYMADEGVLGKGQEDYRKCMNLLSECLNDKRWAAYQSAYDTVYLPHWAFNK